MSESELDPVATARRIFAALEAERWGEAANCVHPEVAERFRSDMIRMASEEMDRRREQNLEWAGQVSPLADVFEVASLRQLEATPAKSLLERFIERQVSAILEAQRAGKQASVKWEVLGSVDEPPTTAHVVYRRRWQYGGQESERVEVQEFRLWDGRWLACDVAFFQFFFLHP